MNHRRPRRIHITDRFNLGLSQHEVDFVDIALNGDTPLFIDPYVLGIRSDAWSISASRTIRSFFQHFISLLRSGQESQARELFTHLHEPNETRLGLSRARPQGRGIGPGDSLRIYDSLRQSRAVQTGIVEHLEDCRVFIEGIDKDKISDMTTNIIRRHLTVYTQVQCNNYGITLVHAPSGFMWSASTRQWENTYTDILIVDGNRLLLVPKAIVSYSLNYSPQQYHQHFVLNFLQHEHLRLGTVLVQKKTRKDGTVREFVTKKSLKATVAPPTKEFLSAFTLSHPEIFAQFKEQASSTQTSLSAEEFTDISLPEVAARLYAELQQIRPGRTDADRYEKVIAAILELIFYPHLIAPEVQVKIHQGRKRIDIVYDNAATNGFFFRLHSTYHLPCQFVFVECKNYNSDPNNPELDQLSSRFSPNRGRFGMLVCRNISDLDEFLERCADTYHDDRGLVIPITDQDLLQILDSLRNQNPSGLDPLLQERYRRIALR